MERLFGLFGFVGFLFKSPLPSPPSLQYPPLMPTTSETPPRPITPTSAIEEKLDEILVHLRKMDKRDRSRMFGGYLKTIVSLISIGTLLWSVWYFAVHGQELMKGIAGVAASAAADATKNQSQSLYDSIINQYKTPDNK